ncbi:MAG: hypothetical protein ACK5P5_13980 [Pseudobdellovibrionaceae bacterium]
MAAFFCLALAGGIEMLSYMSGPMIGNARAGFVASISKQYVSILSGGILCVIFVGLSIYFLPQFWSYRRDTKSA